MEIWMPMWKKNISSQTTDGIVKWIVLQGFMIQLPPFWKIKHVLKYQVCNCGLFSDRWAPGTVVNAPFECSSMRRMVWKGCWKPTPPPPPPLLHGNKCIQIICNLCSTLMIVNIVVTLAAGRSFVCQTFHQCWNKDATGKNRTLLQSSTSALESTQKISEAKRCSFNPPAIGRRVPTVWALSCTRFPPVKRGFFLPLMLVEACWETGCADCEGCQRQAGPVGHGGDLAVLDVSWPFPLGPASCWSCQYKHSLLCSLSQSPLPPPTPKLMARQRMDYCLCVSWPNTDSDFNINQCWLSNSSVWSCVLNSWIIKGLWSHRHK